MPSTAIYVNKLKHVQVEYSPDDKELLIIGLGNDTHPERVFKVNMDTGKVGISGSYEAARNVWEALKLIINEENLGQENANHG